jgi:hypothetical protein
MASLVLLLPRGLMKAIIFCIFKNISNGYRYNTDFDNQNFVLKSVFNKNKLPITMLVALEKFGANGFMLRQRLLINMRKQRLV